jgi:hypothetical protein
MTATAAATRRPEIVQALNYCLTQTGCTKEQALLMVIRALVDEGIPMQTAWDEVGGPGTYQMISDTTWELLQPAA